MSISIQHEQKTISGEMYEPETANNYAVVLTHGAGGDMHHSQLVLIANILALDGFHVLRFTCKGLNIIYRSRVYLTVLKFLHNYNTSFCGCILAGRSMGSRAAVMAANLSYDDDDLRKFVVGVVCLAYPLHPPRKPKDLRDEPLKALRHPCLFISGTKDNMSTGGLLQNVSRCMTVKPSLYSIHDADHGFRVSGRTEMEVVQDVGRELLLWCHSVVGNSCPVSLDRDAPKTTKTGTKTRASVMCDNTDEEMVKKRKRDADSSPS